MAKTNGVFFTHEVFSEQFHFEESASPNGTFLVDFTALWYYIVFACQICFCPSGYTLSEEEWTKKFHFFYHDSFAPLFRIKRSFIQKGIFQFGNILQIYSIVFPKKLTLDDHNIQGIQLYEIDR